MDLPSREPAPSARRVPEGDTSGGARTDASNASAADTSVQQGGQALPSISLPKGGGAISGIGEKFSVNPANGTSSITIPLASSPGRAEFGPQLAISYDSGRGNGEFGFGWSIALPEIIRKTDKGLPRYNDSLESDVFILSGAEDLVPILDGGQRFVIDRRLHGVDYDVRCYRPRVEGLFARVERWTDRATSISHWRSITRDNVTTLYGLEPASRLADPDDSRRVFAWRICRTWDDKGNVAAYEYVADDDRGVDLPAAHESNRSAAARATNRYLKRVRYGGTTPYFPVWSGTGIETPLPSAWHFEIVFDYGDHPLSDPLPAPGVDWPVRPDPFSTFRAGFEIRTYRRCQRVLLFHHFLGESGIGGDCLVRSTELHYSDEAAPADPRNPIYTFLASVTQTGHRRAGTGYVSRSMPPLELEYSQPRVQPDVRSLDRESVSNLPAGLDGERYQFVDLDGEGASGILTDEGGSWAYKRNLSPLDPARARFTPREEVASVPSHATLGGAQQLLDLSGDGKLDLVAFADPLPGFFERTSDDRWELFRPFASLPRIDWSEPNLKFVDLTGDGHADVLLTEDGAFTFYPSLGEAGFGEPERVAVPWDERRGPAVVLADGTQTIFLADMSGDGLSDLVRIRNGEVCYWPNQGYGRFGGKVTMDGAPRLDDDERFDPRRIRLADVDGSGTTDLLYVADDAVLVCFNQSGNRWAVPHRLGVFPSADLLGNVQVFDLLGNGTACLVWSSPLPAAAEEPLRYVDLMGGNKPHLLVRVRNNLGAETRLRYAPSTRFYLEDKLAGRPWLTRIPFPVHVVERMETYDWIGRSRFVTSYAYHHGYFDGEEREFRGFGMVEQRDTEAHREDTLFPDADPMNEQESSFVPPVLTRTWFHTGAFLDSPGLAPPGPESVIDAAVAAEEIREAYRALKGSTLRIEVYAEDGSARAAHPYSVVEQSFFVRRVQGRGPNRHAVFFTHPRESVSHHYERQPDDARVMHEATLAVDDFGNVTRSISAGYPRTAGHPDPEPLLSASFRAMLAHDQSRLHVSATERSYTIPLNRPESIVSFDAYRAPLPSETITAELTGIAPAGARFTFDELTAHWTSLWNGAHDVPYETVLSSDIEGTAATPPLARRIIEHARTLYRSDDLTALRPLHSAGALALTGESYRLALTPNHIARIFGTAIGDAVLSDGGYVRPAGRTDWWIPSGRVFFSPGDTDSAAVETSAARAHFYRPRRAIDALGGVTRVDYDAYDLLPSAATDASGNVTTAVNDYRVLRPARITDPNGNHSAAAFHALGQVVGTAIAGKAGEGDSLTGFAPDLSDAAIAAIDADPLDDPGSILGDATSRVVYDELAYYRTRDDANPLPPSVYTLTRETHVSDLAPGQRTRYHHHFAYSDGTGRVAQQKAQAEPGADGAPRWVGSGWTIYNNKGKPVRKYEPFFSPSHRFELDRQAGVSSILFYDPVERVVATLHPDNTIEKTRFDAWRSETWDRNDTCLISDPRTDADAGDFFTRLLGTSTFVSWHDLRIGGTLGATAAEQSANKDAAQKAAAHAATPAVAHFDSLGRTCLAIADNGQGERHATRTALDPDGEPLCVIDPLGRRVMEWCLRVPGGYVAGYDIAGNPLYRNSMDGGERRLLNDATGNPLRTFDARGSAFRFRYDAARRLTHRFVKSGTSAEILFERLFYGEPHADATRNLKGRLYRHYDGAGVASHDRYDFKGNVVESGRQFAVEYRTTVDWAPLATATLSTLDTVAAPLLEAANAFNGTTRFNALNQPVQIVTPHAAGGAPSVIQPQYNEASLLERLDAWIRRSAAPAALLDPAAADLHAVTDIDYDAHGRRVLIGYGNGAETTYDYDPETFRLTRLMTVRPNVDPDARTVQDLSYTYDPAGNISRIRDDAQQTIYFNGQVVPPHNDYTYDAVYRLINATGREHIGQLAQPETTWNDEFRVNLPHPADGQALRTYTEQYLYDVVGNFEQLIHQAVNANWTRAYTYAETSPIEAAEKNNRLSNTTVGATTEPYTYDAHGNMTSMPHLTLMQWNFKDQLSATSRQAVNPGSPETTYYVYDAAGERIRKVTERQSGTRKEERIYLGGFEVYRKLNGTGIALERETLHVTDDTQRIALVETRTLDPAGTDTAPQELIRYQFANHIASASLELNDQAQIISYEEYTPYGASAYQAIQTAVPKRYRYTGKERDEESGLYYHGARYYAQWLGRWVSCDPAGVTDGLNLFEYCRCSPTRFKDESGTQHTEPQTQGQKTGDAQAQEKTEFQFLTKAEAVAKWSALDLEKQGIQLEAVEIRPPTELAEVVVRPPAVFVGFIGGLRDRYPVLGLAPTHIMLGVRNEFVRNLDADTTNSDYFNAKYYGYQDVQMGQVKKDIESAMTTNPQTKVYLIGHSLGGWEGATMTKDTTFHTEMLITVDPVGTGLSYTGAISFKEPEVSADRWINILANPKKNDESDWVATAGGRWNMKEGPDRRDTSSFHHRQALQLMKHTPASRGTAPQDTSAWDLLTEKIQKELLWLKSK